MDSIKFSDVEVYDDLSFADLLKEIHKNTNKKSKVLDKLISDISGMIDNPNSAVLLVPLLAQYLNVSVANDDQLIKMANVIQRYNKGVSSSSSDSGGLTDEEKAELLKNAREVVETGKLVKVN